MAKKEMKVTEIANSYDWKKTGEKALWGLGYTLITGAIVVWQDDVRFMALIPALMAAQNFIKHRA